MRFQVLHCALELYEVLCDDEDVGASGGEEARDGEAEALGSAGDDGAAAGDGEVVLAR